MASKKKYTSDECRALQMHDIAEYSELAKKQAYAYAVKCRTSTKKKDKEKKALKAKKKAA